VIDTYVDPVRLGEQGWKQRYYLDKFRVTPDDGEFIHLIKQSYIEGICWVYEYYYNGCPSWEWYYPFHYAPFASDLVDLDNLVVEFNLGHPFQPIEQLLSVLPPYSSHALPVCLRPLMHDPDSEIIDFYPSDIKLDVNGHAFAWMGVNLIPFIEEDRIRNAVNKYVNKFTPEEDKRNELGSTLIYFDNGELSKIVNERYKDPNFSMNLSHGMHKPFSGLLKYDPYTNLKGNTFALTNKEIKFDNIKIEKVYNCQIITMKYELVNRLPHQSCLLQGLTLAQRTVFEDITQYNKKNFKGEQAIRLVQSTLGYRDDADVEETIRRDYFDRSYNNNRAIEYNPGDLQLLQKKKYQQQLMFEREGGKRQKTDESRYQTRYEDRGYKNREGDVRKDYQQERKRDEYKKRDHLEEFEDERNDDRSKRNKGKETDKPVKSLNKEASMSESLLTSFFQIDNSNLSEQTNSQKSKDKQENRSINPSDAFENMKRTYQQYANKK
jgi:5'-3' exonuclease